MEIIVYWFWSVVAFFNSSYEGEAFVSGLQARLEFTNIFRFFDHIGVVEWSLVGFTLLAVFVVANGMDKVFKNSELANA